MEVPASIYQWIFCVLSLSFGFFFFRDNFRCRSCGVSPIRKFRSTSLIHTMSHCLTTSESRLWISCSDTRVANRRSRPKKETLKMNVLVSAFYFSTTYLIFTFGFFFPLHSAFPFHPKNRRLSTYFPCLRGNWWKFQILLLFDKLKNAQSKAIHSESQNMNRIPTNNKTYTNRPDTVFDVKSSKCRITWYEMSTILIYEYVLFVLFRWPFQSAKGGSRTVFYERNCKKLNLVTFSVLTLGIFLYFFRMG